jgi:hypothetical protein
MPPRPNPEELEEIIKNHKRFEYYGHYFGEDNE